MLTGTVTQQFNAAATGTITAIQRRLVALAKTKNAEVMAADPKPLNYTRWVDGTKDAIEETAKATSVIVYEYNRIGEIAEFARDYLIEVSPDKSGKFKSSWQLIYNGTIVDRITRFNSGDIILVANDQPYARKIVSGHMHLSVPHNLTERAKREVNRRFGNTVLATDTFVPLAGGYILKGHFHKGFREHARVRLQKDTQAGAIMNYPALQIVGR